MRLAVVCALVLTVGARADDKPAFPVVSWSGTIAEAKLKDAPESDLITNQKTFAALWQSWRVGEEVPQVNFDSHFVLVLTQKNTKMRILQYSVDSDGGMRCTKAIEADGKGIVKKIEGVGYGIAVIPRAKDMKYRDKPIP